jgi:4-alpha-glucanotransferase
MISSPQRKSRFRLDERASGLLLHATSLPSCHGIGDLGPAAYQFVDFLAAAGQGWWQMLPIGPPGPGDSPYSALSAFAGHPLLISLERLARDGLLDAGDIAPVGGLPPEQVVYAAAARYKMLRLRRAFAAFVKRGMLHDRAYLRFCAAHADWLDDYALYSALRHRHRHRPWLTWEPGLRLRRTAALRSAAGRFAAGVNFERFLQFEFGRQWRALKRYANDHGVGLIGDIPIFVAHDSADVWAHRGLFDLDHRGRPRTVSGVPPDYFSPTGQLWRHPHYRWPHHQATGFAWWIARFGRLFEQFDAVRIDHFLGFTRVWAVPGQAKTARHGKWVKTTGAELLAALRRRFGRLGIIAEDLGLATPAAIALRDRLGLPGMRLLQFAFGAGEGSRYNQPHTFPRNCVVYPGTHDNETTAGWFRRLQREAHRKRGPRQMTERERALRYLGTTGREIHWDMIRLALSSPANLAVIPVQDILGLGNEARMNKPATATGNWRWRLRPGQLTSRHGRRLLDLTEIYGRVHLQRPTETLRHSERPKGGGI